MTGWRKINYDFLKSLTISGKVLDLGCGRKEFMHLYGDTVTTVDIDPAYEPDIVADLNEPLTFSGQYDWVILNNVLEHIYDARRLIKESHGLLTAGGKLVILVPFMIKIHQDIDHHRYTNQSLERMLREAGFSEVSISPEGTLGDIYKTIRNDIFGLVPRYLRPLKWISYAPRVSHPAYPWGYHVVAIK
ncbi:hypothetical protein COU17_02765 [Candidatus Kaiserbacteria bacterium CG10_big_fil_rev_8_21_14_0_10_49_17]|uniref:Methyltransferase type 11 domain-containing protein n=1 Tax=Candidatus Kaiserbacteria bacterium CG10_big_fil_rev_8_21_14_0_10_49_17 TaxID=1974609 RepID=A0A2M6WDZ5_9BACT|nr:MAG: hypothetical protein COU17_02765 [Candidatus Kaiserbacteria bacterium CG10_big_fil_rev_8_21_14_0_10_49_17]